MSDDNDVFPGCLDAVVKRRVDDRGRVAIGAVPGVSPHCFVRAVVWQHGDDLVDTDFVSGVVDDRQRLAVDDIDTKSERVTVAVLEISGENK